MGGLLLSAQAPAVPATITTALGNIGTVITQAIGIITGNDVLMVFFCGCLLGVGYKVIKQAKRAAK